MVELVVTLAIASIVFLFAGPYLLRIYRREKLKSTVREVHALVLAARLEAVKRNQNTALQVDAASGRLVSWVDNLPYNFIQDVGERVVNNYTLPRAVTFVLPGGITGATVMSFDKYNADENLIDRIVFRGDGTLVDPEATYRKRPLKPVVYTSSVPNGSANCPDLQCRGIYMTDQIVLGLMDIFRISVDDFGSAGKVSILKWLPITQDANPGEVDWVPPPWKWVR
jgi:type II secretory pathway pseudopilin PulG